MANAHGNQAQVSRDSDRGPHISVVVPSYNRKTALLRCLEALAEQDHPGYEIIVVDDASTDGTVDCLKEFAEAHPQLRIQWLVNKRNCGSNVSRNRGVREARGRLVAFLDSDCVAAPDWLSQLGRGFEDPTVAAVTGGVIDVEPTNIYELTFKGMHRVHGGRDAPRLIAGNMCIRRDILLEFPLDEDLHWGGDEEGIYLRLKAAGYSQRRVPGAIVRHEHYHTAGSFFAHARAGGRAAAWMIYKYGLPPRLDLLPLLAVYATLPLIAFGSPWSFVPAFFAVMFLAALVYNELWRKEKTLYEMAVVIPLMVAYYHVRLAAHLAQYFRYFLRIEKLDRIQLKRQIQSQ